MTGWAAEANVQSLKLSLKPGEGLLSTVMGLLDGILGLLGSHDSDQESPSRAEVPDLPADSAAKTPGR